MASPPLDRSETGTPALRAWSMSIAGVVDATDTDPTTGLTSAEVARRQERDGPNEIAATPPMPWWQRLGRQFTDPLVILLLVAIVISLIAWWSDGADETPLDHPLAGFLGVPVELEAMGGQDHIHDLERGPFVAVVEAMTLTLVTSVISLLVVVLLGTPLAYLLARRSFPGKALVETFIDLPMVLPPAVAGLALLMAFGRRGLIGSTLDGWGITIGFTTTAVVMAQIFVASPFFVRAARSGFARSERNLEEAATDLGASPAAVFRTVTLPLAQSGLAAGAVLAWARAVGEFGATIIFAGSIAGVTQTMPLAIYSRFEAGDLETALLLGVLLLAASMLVLLAVRLTRSRAM